MLSYLIRIPWRSLQKHRVISIIHISGLTIGMCCFLMIYFFIRHELSFDKFHSNAPNIYRICTDQPREGAVVPYVSSVNGLGPSLVEEFPEILASTRFGRMAISMFQYGENRDFENNGFWADGTLFDVFDFELERGNPDSALVRPNTLVISREFARKYFGDQDPLNQTIRLNNANDFVVTGVLAEIPSESHLQFDYLLSLSTLGNVVDSWQQQWIITYILVHSDTDMESLQHNTSMYFNNQRNLTNGLVTANTHLVFQPLLSIHLHSHRQGELGENGHIVYIYVLGIVAISILAIACINFINLSTAMANRRAKEVGIRKTFGAQRNTILLHFLGESYLLTGISLFLALLVTEMILPLFGNVMGRELLLNSIDRILFFPLMLAIVLIVGTLSGTYPAVVLSRFNPAEVLRLRQTFRSSQSFLRQVFVVFQFTISIFLIICAVVVYQQMNLFSSSLPDTPVEQVMYLRLPLANPNGDFEVLCSELRSLPGVVDASCCNSLPGILTMKRGYRYGPEDRFSDFMAIGIAGDPGFLNTFNLNLIAGRNFRWADSSDFTSRYIVNETTARTLGYEPQDFIGEWLRTGAFGQGAEGPVIGVVEDFHYYSLHEEIEPFILQYVPGNYALVALRMQSDAVALTIDQVRNIWNDVVPEIVFVPYFLDDNFNRAYRNERRLGTLFSVFSFLAVFIACLGLFGLTSYSVNLRRKEICIRKILGASTSSIVRMLSGEILRLMASASVLAWLFAFGFIRLWLQGFPYRIDISLWPFVIGTALGLMVATLIVSGKGLRAAQLNASDELRIE